MREFLIVYNPAAGAQRASKLAQKAAKIIEEAGGATHLVSTLKDQPLSSQLEVPILMSATDVLVVGGDGTLHAVINAIRHLPIAIVPAGTGNDFVKNLRIGSDFSSQMATALFGSVQEIDLGLCNGRFFLNGVGIGFDGQVVEDMLFRKTWLKGHLAYYSTVLRILSGYREQRMKISADALSIEEEVFLGTVGNGTTFGGGFRLTPHAVLDDGWLDVCIIRKLPAWRRFANIHRLSKGSHLVLPEISEHRVKKIRIDGGESIAAHIDGDYLGHPPFEIEIRPGAGRIRVAGNS